MFAITGYEISLWLHISGVVVLGATLAEALTFPVAMRMDPRHLPFVYRLQLAINTRLANPALLLVLVTGIYQVIDGNWEFGDPWVSGGFAIVIVLGALLGGYFIPTDRKLEAQVTEELAAAGDGPVKLSEAFQAKARQEGIVGAVTGALIVIAIFLMVVKPGM